MDKTEHVPFVWILGSVSAMLFFGWLFLRNSEAQVAWEYNDEPQPENHDNTL